MKRSALNQAGIIPVLFVIIAIITATVGVIEYRALKTSHSKSFVETKTPLVTSRPTTTSPNNNAKTGPVSSPKATSPNNTAKTDPVSSPIAKPTSPVAPTGTPPPANTNGIEGNTYCTDKIVKKICTATFDVYYSYSVVGNSDQPEPILATVTSDVNGYFQLMLKPDSYSIVPKEKPDYPIFLPRTPNPVIVSANQFTKVDINYHDGTR